MDKLIFGILTLGLLLPAPAQDTETRVKRKDLPPAVQKTVLEQSKGASIRGLSKEVAGGKTFYEVELKIGGHTKDVLMDPAGAIVTIEEEVTLASLSPAVRGALEKGAGKGKIRLVESITENNFIVAYEAHVKTAGKESEIKVKPDGTLLPNTP
jgi:hypothetical protein